MHVGGKLECRRGQVNALGGLIYLQDSSTNQRYLVDTGAAVSVLPHSSKSPSSGQPLSGADGRRIPSWGTVSKKLTFGFKTFLCSFILAAVAKPILGVDFLAQHHLLVDPFSQQVLDAATLKPICPSAATAASGRSRFTASLCHVSPAVRSLLASFPAVVGDGSGTPRPKHGIEHFIETSGRPIFAKARRLDPEKLRAAESEFRALEKAGIVRRSNSPWSSPLHMVPKPDGSWRPCGDYRRLNLATTHDRYPLPSILDLSSKLHGCRYFSVIDLVKGYHQVPMAPEDIQKTAIITVPLVSLCSTCQREKV
jgi:cleavage and polyadenylation specificity factor subunit 1